MKKTVLYKLLASTILVSTICVSASDIFAQRRSQQNDKIRYKERNKQDRLREYNRKDKYNKSEYRSGLHEQKNHPKKYKKHKPKHQKGKVYHHKKHKSHYHGSYAHKPRYKHFHKHVRPHYRYRNYHNHLGHNCYHHSQYGDVVIRFAVEPTVIPHHYGDYYFSNGYYYKFYPEIGYVLVDPPHSVYFRYLPDDCYRTLYFGNVYYTNGHMFFVKHRKGFRLVKAPLGIHLSFRF